MILLIPGRRDSCWNMGAKDSFEAGWNADKNIYNNKGAQNKAILAMINRLKEPKDSSLDPTTMTNHFDIATYIDADSLGIEANTFADRLGLYLSMNGRNVFN